MTKDLKFDNVAVKRPTIFNYARLTRLLRWFYTEDISGKIRVFFLHVV